VFTFERFSDGECALCAYYDTVPRLFAYLKEKGVQWANGKTVGEETLTLSEDERYYVNEEGVRRYNSEHNYDSCISYYIMVDGKLHKKLCSYVRANGIEVFDFNNIPNENEIDADGYEKESY